MIFNRRFKLGLLTTVTAMAGVAIILLILHTLSKPQFRSRWDLTQQGQAGLSERTADALASLPEGSRAVAFLLFKENRLLSQNGAQVYPQAYGRLRVLLEDARIRSRGNLEITVLEEFSSPVEIEAMVADLERQPLEVLAIETPNGQRRKFLFDELFATIPPSPDGAPARLVQERIDSALGDAAVRLASGKILRAGVVSGYGQPYMDREQGLAPFLRLLQSEGLDPVVVEGPAEAAQQDLDLLVVVDDSQHRRRTAQAIYMKMVGLGYAVDIVVVTETDVHDFSDQEFNIINTALQQGREVYAA